MKNYVCGFFKHKEFNEDCVLLIRKNRPEWQAGKCNGVGGHIEIGETPLEAMVREFREETGCETKATSWREFVVLKNAHYVCHFFEMTGDTPQAGSIKSMTDEEVIWVPINELYSEELIPNLHWLIPLSSDRQVLLPPITLETK